MSFLTEKNVYYWKRIDPKNDWATYQKLVNYMFSKEIEEMMEVYVNDILVKSLKREEHLGNLAHTFTILQKFNMRLNP